MTATVWGIVGIFSAQSEGLRAANRLCTKEQHRRATCWGLCEQQWLPGSWGVLWCAAGRWGPHKVREHNQSSVRDRWGGLGTRERALNPGAWQAGGGHSAKARRSHAVLVYSSVYLSLCSQRKEIINTSFHDSVCLLWAILIHIISVLWLGRDLWARLHAFSFAALYDASMHIKARQPAVKTA